jgi:thiamine-phosphate pyrophosphorylase
VARPAPPFRLLAISQLDALPAGAAGAVAWFAALAAAGVDALQLREKSSSDRALFLLALQARAAFTAPERRARLLVNGRADVALAAGADGVHLPAAGVPADSLRARFGAGLLIGVSTHDPAEIELARQAGADYVVFGPVYPTPGKADAALTGAQGLARAVAAAGGPSGAGNRGGGIPVYALGGVTLERFAEVAAAGAAGIAAIRLFQSPAGLDRVVAAAHEHFP